MYILLLLCCGLLLSVVHYIPLVLVEVSSSLLVDTMLLRLCISGVKGVGLGLLCAGLCVAGTLLRVALTTTYALYYYVDVLHATTGKLFSSTV